MGGLDEKRGVKKKEWRLSVQPGPRRFPHRCDGGQQSDYR
jgi:hypothetical protein